MNMYRLTTNGMLHTYRANLQHSYKTLATASQKVQTGRNFLSYAEDPASATLAFKLRREFWQTGSQLRNNNSVASTFSQAYASYDLMENKLLEQNAHVNALRGLNDPNGSSRKTLGQSSISAAETAMQSMNAKYAGRYIFAGADGKNAPFTMETHPVLKADGTVATDAAGKELTSTQLCYRGIPVNQPEKLVQKDQQGNVVTDPVTGEPVMVDNPDYLKLKEMLNEVTYVDIGLGMQENPDGTPVKSTVYNSALNGLEFLDFGVDEDGDPKNSIALMLEIGDTLNKASDMDGKWYESEPGKWENSSEAYERLFDLTGKLEKATDKSHVEFTELTTKASYLKNNGERLEGEMDELNQQILDVEEIDPVAAITALSWAQYCYNAGLKIGNSILSQSLIDYMN